MKLVTKIIPVITLFITMILLLFFLDTSQSNKYLNVSFDKHDFIQIKYDENVKLDDKIMSHILELAKDKNVILQKVNYNQKDTSIRDVYLSLDTTEELFEFLNPKLNIKKLNQTSKGNAGFISTYLQNNQYQFGLISDLLENNKYNYYTFSQLLTEQGNLYGNYTVYYQNRDDFTNFNSKLQSLLKQDTNSYYRYQNLQTVIFITIIVSVIVLMLFYFVFQIYEIYYKSNYISCMRLLGFDDLKIVNKLITRRMTIYIILEIIILALSIFLIKNITFYHWLVLLLSQMLVLLMTYFIYYTCVKIITRKYQLSNILKKQNIALKINKISMKLKIIVAVVFIILIAFIFQNVLPLYQDLIAYKNEEELLDYGVISTLGADTEELYHYKDQSKLYTSIINDKNINTLYADFHNFKTTTKEEQKMEEVLEDNGKYFKYASVDINYLKKEKLKLYDYKNRPVNLSELNGIFFLFPKSRKNQINSFEKFYREASKSDYEKYGIDDEFNFYLYDDQLVNTYLFKSENKKVKSPILRVIDGSLTISYLETPLGIDIAGTGMQTSLKIEVKTSKEDVYKFLEPLIKEAGLQNMISQDSFISYRDYFKDEIELTKNITFVTILILLLIFIIHFIISVQTIILYVKSENRKVFVKYLLGYDKSKIFDKIICQNILQNIIAFVVAGIILIILQWFYIWFYIIAVILFIVIDSTVLFITIKRYRFSNIHLYLKGENYD